MTVAALVEQFKGFVKEARRLQQDYKGRMDILVGMETEYCDEDTLQAAAALQEQHRLDYVVGSVHHVLGIPIDFSPELYEQAEQAACGTEALFVLYFRMLEKMVLTLRPTVIGHFDLIRLFRPFQPITPLILAAARGAARAGVECGCVFELNSSAYRKGFSDPYPQRDFLAVREEESKGEGASLEYL